MKRLAVLTFLLGLFVMPLQAQAQKSVTFNGMVFDSPPTAGVETPAAPAKPKAVRHTKKRNGHKPSAS